MENFMLTSIVFLLLLCLAILELMLYPKTESRLNGCKLAVMAAMALLCYLAFFAELFYLFHLPLNLKISCVPLILLDAVLFGAMIWRRKVQKLFFRLSDLLGLLIISSLVIIITVHIFTPQLLLQYGNIDAATHFKYASKIVNTGKLPSITYFSAYIDALFIWLLKPMLSPVLYFKAFIVGDIFMHMLEMYLFYYLVLSVSDSRPMRIMAPLFCIGYFFGYPAYSYMLGNFVYWSNGVMILIFMIYALFLIERHPQLLKYSIPLLLLGAYANTCCNKLFVPINTLALFAALFVIFLQKHRQNRKRLLAIAGALTVCAAGAAVLYFAVWGSNLGKIFAELQKPGWIYQSLYADLIFFIPAFLYVLYLSIKENYSKIPVTLSVAMIAFTVAMYILCYNKLISMYYYYKIYYNLWLLGWLLIAAAFHIMQTKRQLAGFFSYLGMAAVICILTLTGYNKNMAAYKEDYQYYFATSDLFSVYRYNMDAMEADFGNRRISDQILDAFHYAMTELSDQKVRIVTSDNEKQIWHDALDWNHPKGISLRKYGLNELLRSLDKKKTDAILVLKQDEEYAIYKDYFDRNCSVIYENPDAVILKPAGERWRVIPQEEKDSRKAEKKLCSYVKKHLNHEKVPLLASRESYYDSMLYYLKTKQNLQKYYPWSRSMNALATKLNKDKVSYVAVLYDDSFYREMQWYFDALPTVYENEAGKIVTCPAGQWTEIPDPDEETENKENEKESEEN